MNLKPIILSGITYILINLNTLKFTTIQCAHRLPFVILSSLDVAGCRFLTIYIPHDLPRRVIAHMLLMTANRFLRSAID
jgi:hypothetical protein